MNDIPDVTTVALLREQLRKAGVIEELFQQFDGYLHEQGLEAHGEQIIDATLIPVPKQRNSRNQNKDNCLRDGIRIPIDCSRRI